MKSLDNFKALIAKGMKNIILGLQKQSLQMADLKKQAALDKYRTLLFAILDYHLKYYTGSMVFDDWDPSADYYLLEKQQTEEDYQNFRLDILEQRLGKFVQRLRYYMDLNFGSYLKEHTGYEMDIYEDLRHEIATIISRGKVENIEELSVVHLMIQVYKSTSVEKEQIDILANLIDEFSECEDSNRVIGKSDIGVKQNIVQFKVPLPNSEYITMVATTGTIEKLSKKEFMELERKRGVLSSPRNIGRQIATNAHGFGKNAHTEVGITLNGGSGCIYCVKGENLLIKAYWKNNNTVVIETKKEYVADVRHNQVGSFEDVVKIEYIEI
ncbi:MAG TPA: hypothetical protein VL125_11025 [Pelobium sp.]|nr:hypothetical protein [Pelobium sp.]